MTNSELKNITSRFEEVKTLIEKHNTLLNETTKIRRRLKTKIRKYTFLKNLVDIDSCGDKLVNSVVQCFKEMGFDDIENVDKKYKDEDIRLFIEDTLILFEITGIDNANPPDDKVHQISKHIPIRQKKYPTLKVFGVFMVNHDNKKHFSNREKKPFRKALIDISKEHKYTITTTLDLLVAFIKIKAGKLTKEELIEKLCTTGELKILGYLIKVQLTILTALSS